MPSAGPEIAEWAAELPRPAKTYPVRLAGTRSYAAALASAAVGDVVMLLCEDGNPFDPDALAIVTADGALLGYVPRDSWLRRAVLEDRRGVAARIEGLDGGATIAVTLTDDQPGRRIYEN